MRILSAYPFRALTKSVRAALRAAAPPRTGHTQHTGAQTGGAPAEPEGRSEVTGVRRRRRGALCRILLRWRPRASLQCNAAC